ncbi:MAG TPA: transposase, partial [Tepidiformaceae bacterium]
ENAIRDLKYGVGLNHLPSGKFGANGAWLAVQVIAHNLARWTARIGLGEGIVTTKTLRQQLFSVPGWLTRSARVVTVHLPARWPWAVRFTAALATLRALSPPA